MAGPRSDDRALSGRELEEAIAALPEPLAAEVRALACFYLVVRSWRYFMRLVDRAERTAHRRAAIYAKLRERDDSIAFLLAHQVDLIAIREERDRHLATARACEALLYAIAGDVARTVVAARAWAHAAELADPPF